MSKTIEEHSHNREHKEQSESHSSDTATATINRDEAKATAPTVAAPTVAAPTVAAPTVTRASIGRRRERILAISTGGAALALSFVLSRITMFRMPMGGSVTPASMLPLLLFAMAFGPGFGYGACAIMAVLQLIGGYLLFPLQVVLDYLLPFTIFGSVGFLHSNTQGSGTHGSGSRNFLSRIRSVRYVRAAVCTLLCYAAQLLCSTLSGVIFYSEYAGDMNVWAYSFSYNALFIAPECIITLLAMSAVFALARKSK